MIMRTMVKVRQQILLIKSFQVSGLSSPELSRALFSSFVLPFFTCIYSICPLFSDRQRSDLSHFYYTCLRRILGCFHWNEQLFAYALDEKPLDDRCLKY